MVPVKDLKQGRWYIGIKNPSEIDGVNVNLEVVAVVQEKVLVQKTEEQTKAELYGNMGWQAYLRGELDKCIEYSKKSLEFEPSPAPKCNIALCYLVQNRSECVDSYVDAIAACKRDNNSRAYLEAALKDINDAVKKFGALPKSNEIVTMINEELQ